MNTQEAAMLLTIAAAFDNRKPDPDAAQAWALALEDLPYLDCRDAIVSHYRRSGDWLMPNMVIAEVRKVRNKRIADHEAELTPPPDCREGRAMHEWLAQAKRRLGDGEPVESISYVDPELKARHLPDLRALIAKPSAHPEADPNPAPPTVAAHNQAAVAAKEAAK